VAKTTVIYIKFLPYAAYQKLGHKRGTFSDMVYIIYRNCCSCLTLNSTEVTRYGRWPSVISWSESQSRNESCCNGKYWYLIRGANTLSLAWIWAPTNFGGILDVMCGANPAVLPPTVGLLFLLRYNARWILCRFMSLCSV